MTKLKLGLAVAVISVAGVACGADNKDNNVNGDTNNTQNNTEPNNDPNNMTNNTDPNNGPNNTPNNTTNNTPNNTTNSTTNNDTGGEIPEPPGCEDENPPARCGEDPSTFAWASASVVDDFFIEGTADDPICCFDYDGEPGIDNALGMNLAGFEFLADINASIETSIANGSLVLVLEHDGMDDLANDDDFTVNFFIGEHDYADLGAVCADETECDTGVCNIPADEVEGECGFEFDGAGANPVLLAPESFDQGAQPQAYLPDASVTGGAVAAGPGSVKIEVELFDSPLQLTISLARIEADVDAASSDLADDTGVALASGKLGGVIQVRDIFIAVNEFSSAACECLGLEGEDLVNVDNGMCSENADADACTAVGEDTCAEVAGSCNLLGAVALFADVDLDGDGLNDSVSIGSTFTAKGAIINGVAQ